MALPVEVDKNGNFYCVGRGMSHELSREVDKENEKSMKKE